MGEERTPTEGANKADPTPLPKPDPKLRVTVKNAEDSSLTKSTINLVESEDKPVAPSPWQKREE